MSLCKLEQSAEQQPFLVALLLHVFRLVCYLTPQARETNIEMLISAGSFKNLQSDGHLCPL